MNSPAFRTEARVWAGLRLLFAGAVSCWLAVIVSCAPTEAPPASTQLESKTTIHPKTPNIILISTDDQAPGALGLEGNEVVRTPRLDRLAREGAYFSRAYVPIPQCAPSRAATLTGLYPHQNGVTSNLHGSLKSELATFPRLLKEQGYACGLVGKWHLGPRGTPHRDFQDFWVTFPAGQGYWNPTLHVNGRNVAHRGYLSQILTDYAIQFVEQHTDGPFFLWLAYKAPHFPYVSPPERFRVPDASIIRLPESMRDDLSGKPAPQRRSIMHRLFWTLTPAQIKERLATEYGMIACLDHHIGRLLDRLQGLDLDSETLVIYMSDNGLLRGEHRMMEKGSVLYEELVRSPLIMWWPKVIPAGTRIDALVSSMDLFPTICGPAGAPIPDGLAGKNLWNLLTGQTGSVHDLLFFEIHEQRGEPEPIPLRGLVTLRHKYVKYLNDGEELYDLQADPWEMNNLIDNPDHGRVVGSLRAKLAEWRVRTGDLPAK